MSRKTETIIDLIDIDRRQRDHDLARSSEDQKGIGQFFTPPPIARFMASLAGPIPTRARILDPGAGAGILTAALVERILRLRCPRVVQVEAFETDPDVIPSLRRTLNRCGSALESAGHEFEFVIHRTDFVLDNADAIQGGSGLFEREPFDIAIMNPPYLKIAKTSSYARALSTLVHGQPNLYALFMALGAALLRPGGQFVAITPRSFASGPYFRTFRRWFLSEMTLARLHLFESRKQAFSESGVLQENVITHAVRGQSRTSDVVISHSVGREVAGTDEPLTLPASLVVDDTRGDAIIRIPVTKTERRIVEAMERWPDRFDSLGLRVSTGPVVMFRATEFVRKGHEVNGSIPLLSVQNVRPFATVWPVESERKTLSFRVASKSKKLLIPASNYVLVRRFSAKEEARRLTASPVFGDSFPGQWLALENHLNYVYHSDRPLLREETLGITALLNSRLLDVYFRTISGNTQVNAAEVRAMPFPNLPTVARLGRDIERIDTSDSLSVESSVLSALDVNGAIRSALLS